MLSLLFSCSVVSNSLQPYGLYARFPCSSPSPRVCSNSCPLSQWCHPIISSSVDPFSSHLQSFPGSFLVNWLFASGFQSIGASASVLPTNIHGWFHLGLTGLIFLLSRDSQESSLEPRFKSINSSMLSLLYGPVLTYIHSYWKHYSFYYTDLCGNVMSLFLNIISRFVNCSLNHCNRTKVPATVSWTA